LARLYAAEGDAAAAELSYLRAIVLGSADVALFSDFATWLDEAQRPAEAAFFLKRALQLAPDRVDLRARLARAWQRVGDLPRALEHVNRALAELPEDAPSDELLALQHTLEAALPDGPRRPISAPKDASAQGRLDAARAWLEAGAPEKAMAELRGVDLGAEGAEARRLEVEVRRLEGRVLSAVGREAEALAAFERNPRDATSRLLAGRLRLKRGELSEAEARFEEAQVMGEPRAAVELARLDARYPPDAWPIWSDLWRLGALERAASRLQPFLARADAAGEEARRFSKVLRQRRRLAYSGLIGLGLAFLGLAAALWSASQLRRAVDLATLITAHPEAGPDIQRVLSAIRHEVLKHHALALTGLIEALEAGRPEAAAQAAWCRRSLLGDPAQPDSGAAARLEAYAEALMKIGQAHGARLDLKRKDPALSALLSGFRRLHAARRRLAQAHRLSPGGRRRLTRQLRGAAEALNVRGYEAVQALLDQLRVLRIDAPLLRAIFAQTIQEPAFATQPIAPLALDLEAPCALIISREAFSEILQNLLRNALEASAAAGLRPLEVGLRVRVEIDDITGLAEASFAALDKVEGALDIDALRARPIESGLGLVTRRVTRYEGRLDLWPTSPPWAKAVGVALPLHEGALPPVRTNPLGSRSQGVVRASKEGSSWS
ncbi:tetratricopeptide repeat protein, partial [Myxococcota bacterium]|nr:tetratricopeptide repeat protein [Myxococcota bacterium]MBU1900029.1 tetratricopeptide repeat protein [Myxococcota bacterium]